MANTKKNASQPKSTNGCLPITLLLLVLVAVSLTATFYFLFLRPGPTAPPAPPPTKTASRPSKPTPAAPEAPPKPPRAPSPPAEEEAPASVKEPAPEPEPPPVAPAPTVQGPGPGGARLAIIIDDIGNNRGIAEQLIALDLPLSFSVLPHSANANHLAALAAGRGRDILLHLPMEASDPRLSPGVGGLLLAMSPTDLLATLEKDLDTPYRPIGINNHMGSKFTEHPAAMRTVLEAVKARRLFFVDSVTSTKSVAYGTAKELGLRAGKRDIFLDNVPDRTKILAQIGRAIAHAQKHGQAIAIGHPRPDTLEALRAAQARLRAEATMVPVHELVH